MHPQQESDRAVVYAVAGERGKRINILGHVRARAGIYVRS
jgi:hypothetical protein